MTSTVQAMIAKANARTASTRKQVFAKKANDQQHHENLFRHVEVFVEAYRNDPVSRNTQAALRELSSAMALSKKRLQP
jgi:hypothetical protein